MLLYIQRTGHLYDKDLKLIWVGYSGHGAGLNNPDMQDVKGIGPLPQGIYTLTEPFHSEHTGPFAMRLIPNPQNQMYSRGDFEIHGDNSKGDQSASNGCIVHSPAFERLKIWTDGDHELRVIAEEPDAIPAQV